VPLAYIPSSLYLSSLPLVKKFDFIIVAIGNVDKLVCQLICGGPSGREVIYHFKKWILAGLFEFNGQLKRFLRCNTGGILIEILLNPLTRMLRFFRKISLNVSIGCGG
jgi:hypothetical protein